MKMSIKTIFIIFLISQFVDNSTSKFYHRITRFICATSNKTVLNNVSCFYRTFKGNGYFSFRGTLMRKVINPKIAYTNNRKNSDGWSKVLDIKDIEICKILNDLKSTSTIIPYVKSTIEYFKSISNGNFLNSCNMTGEFYGYNLTVLSLVANNSLFEYFPAGEYLGNVLYHDELDSNIMNLTLQFRLVKF